MQVRELFEAKFNISAKTPFPLILYRYMCKIMLPTT